MVPKKDEWIRHIPTHLIGSFTTTAKNNVVLTSLSMHDAAFFLQASHDTPHQIA